MPLSLEEVQRIAQDVVSARDPNLQVLVASTAEGASGYTELMVVDGAGSAGPCRVVIGVNRTTSEATFRAAVDDHLRQQIERQPGS